MPQDCSSVVVFPLEVLPGVQYIIGAKRRESLRAYFGGILGEGSEFDHCGAPWLTDVESDRGVFQPVHQMSPISWGGVFFWRTNQIRILSLHFEGVP